MATAFEQMFWALVKLCRERPRTALQRATVTATAPLRARVEGEDADAAVEPADGHVLTVGRKRVLLGGSSGGGAADWSVVPLEAGVRGGVECRTQSGLLHLRGGVSGEAGWQAGTWITVAILPAGARPSGAIWAPAYSPSGTHVGTWLIRTTGGVGLTLTQALDRYTTVGLGSVPPRPVD